MLWTRSKSFFPRSTLSDSLNIFNRFMGGDADTSASFPAFNIWSNADGAILTSEIPGVKMEDLKITVSGKEISIAGSRKECEADSSRFLRHERPVGQFSRTFKLPYQIDSAKVEAKLANGVLRIDLPRAENDKPRKIAITLA